MTARRPKPGDVLMAQTPDGAIYVHYLGTHPEYGDAITVSPKKHPLTTAVTTDLFKHGYIAFYPAVAAVRQGLATVVGNLPPASVPMRLRRPGVRERDGKVRNWIVEEGSVETVKQTLSDKERALPIAVIWNHEALVQRIAKGWRPELEGAHE